MALVVPAFEHLVARREDVVTPATKRDLLAQVRVFALFPCVGVWVHAFAYARARVWVSFRKLAGNFVCSWNLSFHSL